MSENKWDEKEGNKVNFEGTQVGELLENLIKLKDHFSEELEKNIENLEYLEKKKDLLLLQRKKRKVRNRDA
jgi:uncharacterized membrane protein